MSRALAFVTILSGVVILAFLDLFLGSVRIPLLDVVSILFSNEGHNPVWNNILMNFRLPRTAAALLVGAGLGVAGLQMQTLFKNPLAGPFVLGISSGASLGVALLILAGYGAFGFFQMGVNSWLVVVSAAIGSGIVFLAVLAISFKVRDTISLLIIGIMLGSVTGAIVGGLQYFSDAQQIQVFLIWNLGSLGGLSWAELQVLIPVVAAGLLMAVLLVKPLNALLLGDNYAVSLGVALRTVRFWVLISTCLLAGGITAFCGPIAFVGLAVPHIARLFFRSGDHRILVPGCISIGMALMLVCDILSQLPGRAEVLPINIVTSIIGAPVVIWLIMTRRGFQKSFG